MMRRRWPVWALAVGLVALAGPAWAQVSPESAEAYAEGQDLFTKRRYQDALAAFQKAVDLDGKNAQAYRAMGRTHREIRDYDKAAEAYQMAVSVAPDYTAAYFELGQLQYTQRKYDEAQESFARVMEVEPRFQDGKAREFLKVCYLKQGSVYFRQRNYRKAAEEYLKAANVDPTDATTYYNMGLAYWRGRSFDKAIDALNTAVGLDSKHSKAYKALGDLYRTTRSYANAIKAYNSAIDIDPKMDPAYINLAATYMSAEQPDKAAGALQRAVNNGLGDARIYSALGHAQAQQKKWESAISSYKKSLAQEDTAEARYRLAVAYHAIKNYDAALTQARSAARDQKFKVPANVIMGDTYQEMKSDGWKEKAIQHYKVGIGDRQYEKYCEDMIDRIENPMGHAEQSN